MPEKINNNTDKSNPDINDNKLIAAMSYLWILCLVPLLTKKDSSFVQFHAKQGLTLFIAEIVVSMINIIPFLGWLIWFFASITFLIISIIGIIKALNGEEWKIPYIYDWSQKIKL